jgi:hypothetical protein
VGVAQAIDLAGHAGQHVFDLGVDLGGPEVIMVISPEAARAAPPETGASSSSRPFRPGACPATAKSGATVALEMTTLPGFMAGTAPFSPKSTISVCAALTTRVMTTSTLPASSAGLAQATPPAAANLSRTSLRTSQACTLKPARNSELATP